MTLLWKTFFLTLSAGSLLFLGWILYYPKPAPQSSDEAVTRMTVLQEDGRYDEAVATVQSWLQNGERDTSRDGILYQQIAIVYIIESYKRPKVREDAVRQAELNLEKSLSLFDQEQSQDIGIDLFGIGGGYEALGDLPVAEKCKFYAKAQQLYERQLPLIQGDTYTANGETFPLEPYRADVRKHLAAAREKFSNAGCPANLVK